MKKIILSLCFVTCIGLTGKAQWTSISSGTTVRPQTLYGQFLQQVQQRLILQVQEVYYGKQQMEGQVFLF